jgi:hypothetical protein
LQLGGHRSCAAAASHARSSRRPQRMWSRNRLSPSDAGRSLAAFAGRRATGQPRHGEAAGPRGASAPAREARNGCPWSVAYSEALSRLETSPVIVCASTEMSPKSKRVGPPAGAGRSSGGSCPGSDPCGQRGSSAWAQGQSSRRSESPPPTSGNPARATTLLPLPAEPGSPRGTNPFQEGS